MAERGRQGKGRAFPAACAVAACAVAALAGGCTGPQSWIAPAGRDAAAVADLFWVMAAGAVVIWVLVVGLMVFASGIRQGRHSETIANRFVVIGGMILPTVVLFFLLLVGLLMLEDMTAPGADLTLEAKGERWWWRIAYEGPDGQSVPVPNELRLPVGRTARVELTADDVIHSFWVPAIGGKMDMVPGRTNVTRLLPTETGVFRGQCAEFCGESHALMAFPVVVMEPAAFEDWLAAQAEPADPPEGERRRAGLDLFLSTGCGACHAIRGTAADGRVGPDLTHVASRLTIGAGLLPTGPEAFRRFITETDEVKPGVRMPAFGMLPEEEIALIAAYLAGLE